MIVFSWHTDRPRYGDSNSPHLMLCIAVRPNNTHTHIQPFNNLWSWTTRVGQYQKKHSPTHTHPDRRTSFIIFLHLQRSMASSLFILRAWQSSQTTSLQVLFGLSLGLGPSTSYFIHFFTQSSSSFHSTSPYHRSLFCCKTNAMSSVPSLSLSSLLGSLSFSLTPHIHLTWCGLIILYWYCNCLTGWRQQFTCIGWLELPAAEVFIWRKWAWPLEWQRSQQYHSVARSARGGYWKWCELVGSLLTFWQLAVYGNLTRILTLLMTVLWPPIRALAPGFWYQ